jgi:dynein heavy chain
LYIQVSRENLDAFISMSPAGNNLRNHVREFPTLVNNTTIDWFNEWPKKTLLNIIKNLLAGVEFDDNKF